MTTPASSHYDVIVAGGGVSGSHAAIAAGRSGARVLLIEQFGFLGGSLTAMGVGPMMTFHNRAGQQLVHGSPQEMVERLQKLGASPGHVLDSTGFCATVTPFDAEMLKIVLEDMVREAGVDILYHTRLVGAQVAEGRIATITIHNKGGLSEVSATQFIDASGDSELVKHAGVPFSVGRPEDGKTQPMTMNLKVGNVDTARFRQFIRDNWDQFDDSLRPGGDAPAFETSARLSLWGFMTCGAKPKPAAK